ncbi:MAG: hypothetical protein WB609_02785 [Candidatus Cybelea sp.]
MRNLKAFAALAAIALLALTPPSAVTGQLSSLKPVGRFSALPPAIVAGRFTVDGVSAKGWEMAEPGGAFSATDVPVPGAPGRRLIFAACNAALCLLHYERGGIAHFYEILALSLGSNGWTAIWNVRGPKPIATFDVFAASVKNGTYGANWSWQSVKGDF